MPSDFVHLHVHTEYSLLDGQSRIDDLVARAKELEMPSIGISDHGVMFGVIDFFRACKAGGVRPVIGMEAYLATRTMADKDPVIDKKPYHLLLWAKNMTGYRNLMKLASEAQLRGYYYRPRVDRDLLARYSEGIIATSGCLAAEIPRLVEDGKDAEAREKIGWYLDVFGEDHFYLELQPHKIENLEVLNRWLQDYRKSNHTKVQFVATNDVHYVRKDDWDAHDTLLCIQTGSLKSEENRMRMEPHDSYYLKSSEEMRAEFLKHGVSDDFISEAFANSLKIAEMTDVNLDSKGYHIPVFSVPARFDGDSGAYLRYLCEKGLSWRFHGQENEPVLQKRIDRELTIIGEMGFNTYFLIVWDLCEFARDADIWWNVRGSGAGSLVAYCMGITNIDPIQNSLLFERFLNPGRVSMPDIDIDYPDDRRGEMIAYAANKYGKDKVAAIITFGTMGAKAAVKDVGRALGADLARVNYATSLIPAEAKQKPIREYIDGNAELQDLYKKDKDIQRILDMAIRLQGMTRHASQHAAGIIIGDRPLDEYTPLHKLTGTDSSGGTLEAVTQFPMETAESIGLLKVDFLGLSTLTILRKACDLVNKHHGTQYNMDNIPYRHDDPYHPLTDEERKMLDDAFELLGRGETIGVFQVESSGMQSMLRGMRPKRFEEIIAGISLYRPGPMDYIPDFNKRLHGEEEVPYKHEKIIPIIKETYGIMVYQEQLMQIASELFGYDLVEADLMRRAVSKKKEKDLMLHKAIFKERGPKNGISEAIAEAIFDEIAFFANYGFNKCLVASTQLLDAATGRIVTIGDLYTGKASLNTTITCDIDNLTLESGNVSDVIFNGVKPVYRLTTQTGRQIDATANHPFYTFKGWSNLTDLSVGERIAVPRTLPVEGSIHWSDEQIQDFVDNFTSQVDESVYELRHESLERLLYVLENAYGDSLIFAEAQARCLQHLYLRIGVLTNIYPIAESMYRVELYQDENIVQADAMYCVPTYNAVETAYMLSAQAVKTVSSKPLEREITPYSADIYWDKIVSIEYIGEAETFDLTIDGTHNFIANDILVHNSHATDYAVITVQNAYLKCHYPAEYMTALLCVQFSETAKVASFLEDCRRMQIPVLPPHVNYSAIDFDIEVTLDSKRGIRFGLGAIKNAGVGALQHIIDERELRGKFKNLEDFCHRVDLKTVGKRALESLAKVGAFEGWGERDDLLHALDRIIGFSTAYHKAQANGQKSLFGESSDIVESLSILPAPNKVTRRDQLGWEKELLGLYVTGRPVDRAKAQFRAMSNLSIIHELKDPEAPKPTDKIRVAGEIVGIKKLVTKNNEPMAILTLEDWHDTAGTIEVVCFPRSWAIIRDYVHRHNKQKKEANGETYEEGTGLLELAVGDIVLIIGKLDTSRETPQILGDKVDFEFEYHSPTELAAIYQTSANPTWMDTNGNGHGSHEEPPPFFDEETGEVLPQATPISSPVTLPIHSENGTDAIPTWANGTSLETDVNPFEDMLVESGKTGRKVHLTVYLDRSSEPDKDRRRLRRVHRTLVAYHGRDSFSIVIHGDTKPTRLNFPNDSTGYCTELHKELLSIVGEGNFEIEE